MESNYWIKNIVQAKDRNGGLEVGSRSRRLALCKAEAPNWETMPRRIGIPISSRKLDCLQPDGIMETIVEKAEKKRYEVKWKLCLTTLRYIYAPVYLEQGIAVMVV